MNLYKDITIEDLEDIYQREPCFAPAYECIRDAKQAIKFLNSKSINYELSFEASFGIDVIIDRKNTSHYYFKFRYLNNSKKYYWLIDSKKHLVIANLNSLDDFYQTYQNLIFV